MKKYVKALRAPFLAGSLAPVLIGGALAFQRGYFSLTFLLLTLVGVGGLHLGANLINDYWDARGSDPINVRLTPFSGGSRVIQEGRVGARAVFALSLLFFALGGGCGIVLIFSGRPLVLILGFLGLLAGWTYSSPPLQLMSRGWGEAVIFFAFGPLVTLGAFYAISGELSSEAFALGVPQGFLITGVIWINQFPDVEADRQAGKRNLVVRLGPRISRHLYALIVLGSFVGVLFLVGWMGTTPLAAIALASFPPAFKAIRIASKEYRNHEALVPAQALTIQTLIIQGLLLSLGLALSRYIRI